jgi:hypothetical protein
MARIEFFILPSTTPLAWLCALGSFGDSRLRDLTAQKWNGRAEQSAKVRHFRGGFIGHFTLSGYESLSISVRYP